MANTAKHCGLQLATLHCANIVASHWPPFMACLHATACLHSAAALDWAALHFMCACDCSPGLAALHSMSTVTCNAHFGETAKQLQPETPFQEPHLDRPGRFRGPELVLCKPPMALSPTNGPNLCQLWHNQKATAPTTAYPTSRHTLLLLLISSLG